MMNYRPAKNCAAFQCFLAIAFMLLNVAAFSKDDTDLKPVVVTAQMNHGMVVYRLNGKVVENSKKNSLLTNLAKVAETRGRNVSVFIIVDVRASFSEIGKLETALDKVDLTHGRRLFVTDFRDETMNEIHWDETPIPIPRN